MILPIEHQILEAETLLSQRLNISEDAVPQALWHIRKNISVLNARICGNIIIAKQDGFFEFLIPVDKEFTSNEHYSFKKRLKLVNATRMRHYGSFGKIQNSLKELNEYIAEKNLVPVTVPYIVEKDSSDNIYDIYIGISENET